MFQPGSWCPPEVQRGWVVATKKRKGLFKLITELVQWENTANESVLERAREEIRKSWRETCDLNKGHPRAAELFNPERLPAFHDPFAGGGSIPLEAQRLGLESYASDLNPVAVLINKAMIEIPPKFAGRGPVGPISRAESGKLERRDWSGAQGLAEDVRRYGAWMREEAFKRIGHLYPLVDLRTGLPVKHGEAKPGQETATVIAWLWARTVKSPDPRFSHVDVPLAATFMLSTKKGKESWVEPVVEGDTYRFTVKTAGNGRRPPKEAKDGTKLSRAAFRCVISSASIQPEYIRTEGKAGRLGLRLMAVVAEGTRERIYLAPTNGMEEVAQDMQPKWKPDVEFFQHALGFRVGNYGFTKWSDLFTPRQLLALTTLSDLLSEVHERVSLDVRALSATDDYTVDAKSYADAVAVYLAFAIDKSSVYWNSLCPWLNQPKNEIVGNSFSRQTIQMVWDFAEANPFCDSGGNLTKQVDYVCKVLSSWTAGSPVGRACQSDATNQTISANRTVSTDPPYFDNIGYADLSDFFYVWLRHSLKPVFPELFSTLVVPKVEELVATPDRHGGREKAEAFFLDGMTQAIRRIAEQAHRAFPITVYYAFKQAETDDNRGTSSTGWETFLGAIILSGLSLLGTWPIRTEQPGRIRETGSNALASSIVLVCRKRDRDRTPISRREFLREMKASLPEALKIMIEGAEHQSPIAPVDLAQAAIGPGMAVFSKYPAVLEADGKPMTVHTALTLINKEVDEYLNRGLEVVDIDTRFCMDWFAEYGWKQGPFGQADVLARARDLSIDRLERSGVLDASEGEVRLVPYREYPDSWLPDDQGNSSVWESLHQIIKIFQSEGGAGAAKLIALMPERESGMRQLAYLLYTLCERKGWAEEARAYNEVIAGWQDMESAVPVGTRKRRKGMELFDQEEEQS